MKTDKGERIYGITLQPIRELQVKKGKQYHISIPDYETVHESSSFFPTTAKLFENNDRKVGEFIVTYHTDPPMGEG